KKSTARWPPLTSAPVGPPMCSISTASAATPRIPSRTRNRFSPMLTSEVQANSPCEKRAGAGQSPRERGHAIGAAMPILPAVLLVIALAALAWTTWRDVGEYAAFKKLTDTKDRQ